MTPLPVITDCTDCGACCTGQTALPMAYYLGKLARPGELRRLPKALLAELKALREKFNTDDWPREGSPCIWYDAETKRCKHYHFRPDICRHLEVGGAGCRRWRQSLGIDEAKSFRSVGGKIVPVEQGLPS